MWELWITLPAGTGARCQRGGGAPVRAALSSGLSGLGEAVCQRDHGLTGEAAEAEEKPEYEWTSRKEAVGATSVVVRLDPANKRSRRPPQAGPTVMALSFGPTDLWSNPGIVTWRYCTNLAEDLP